MGRVWLVCGALLVSLFAPANMAGAECIGSPYEHQIRSSQFIFVGSVTKARAYPTEKTILTDYTFSKVRLIKGAPTGDATVGGTDLVVTQWGGAFGGQMQVVEDEPSFKVGTRVVVLADLWNGRIHARGCTGEPFEIRADSGTGSTAVYVRDARLVLFDDRYLVFASPENRPGEQGLVQFDDQGRPIFNAPLRPGPLGRVIREADSLESARRGQPWALKPDSPDRPIRYLYLSKSQDPGVSVTEDQFVAQLSAIAARLGPDR